MKRQSRSTTRRQTSSAEALKPALMWPFSGFYRPAPAPHRTAPLTSGCSGRRGGEAVRLRRLHREEERGGGRRWWWKDGGRHGWRKERGKMRAYASQFRRTVLHGVAAPSWLLDNGESALVREGRGEVSNTASFVVLRSEIPQEDFSSVCPPLRVSLLLRFP